MPVVLSRLDDRRIRKLGDYKCPLDTIMKKVLIDIFYQNDIPFMP